MCSRIEELEAAFHEAVHHYLDVCERIGQKPRRSYSGTVRVMIRDDFRMDLEFCTAAGKWRCTDIGTRVIVAIRLDKDDASWYNGPPFAVAEWVFDEYDQGGCSLDANDFDMNETDADFPNQRD